MNTRLCLSFAAALLLAAGPALSGPNPAAVAGEKLDSGLGSLPHYSTWSDRSGRNVAGHAVPGESIDDGLGQLPHYSKWVDPSGRDPMGRDAVRVSQTRR